MPAEEMNFGQEEEPESQGFAPEVEYKPQPVRAVSRTLPHSIEAEENLISSCLLDEGATLSKATESGIVPDSFYEPKHAIIYDRLQKLSAASRPIEVSVVAEELKKRRQLDAIGGYAFLSLISSRLPTTAQAEYFIEQVREQSILRNLIKASTGVVEDCFNFSGDIDEFLNRQAARVNLSANGYAPKDGLIARGLTDFNIPPPGDKSVLLGNRYLSRGDILILASTSGMGKSSLSIQAATTWALNRPLFGGFRPHGPLRSLFFQSEDNEGDVAEMRHSLTHAMKLTTDEQAKANTNVRIVTDRIHRGLNFRAEIKRQLALWPADIVWINPLLAFIGGDVNDATDVGAFVREQLNSLNEPPTHAYGIVHHTAKPPKEKQDRRWNEVMYDMAGSADLTNAARAIISLRPSDTPGTFNLVLAKRGVRAGLTKKIEQGAGYRDEPTTTIGIRHSKDRIEIDGRNLQVIHWEECEIAPEPQNQTNGAGRRSGTEINEVLQAFPVGRDKAIGFRAILKFAKEIKPTIGTSTLYRLIEEGTDLGLIFKENSNPKAPRYYLEIGPDSGSSK